MPASSVVRGTVRASDSGWHMGAAARPLQGGEIRVTHPPGDPTRLTGRPAVVRPPRRRARPRTTRCPRPTPPRSARAAAHNAGVYGLPPRPRRLISKARAAPGPSRRQPLRVQTEFASDQDSVGRHAQQCAPTRRLNSEYAVDDKPRGGARQAHRTPILHTGWETIGAAVGLPPTLSVNPTPSVPQARKTGRLQTSTKPASDHFIS